MTSSGNLEYATSLVPQDHLRRGAIYRRIALGCAIAPMAIGLGIVLFYWLFDWDWLTAVGMLMLPLGGLTVLTGFIFTFLWAAQKRAYARKTQTPFSKRGLLLMVVLLLSNFVVAVACVAMGATLDVEPAVYVSVFDDTGATLDRCEVRADWSPRFHGSLKAGDIMEERFKGNRAAGESGRGWRRI